MSMPEPTIITPVGELDLATVDEFRAALADGEHASTERLLVDLSQVRFIDSTGLAAVIAAHDRLRRQRRTLALVVPDGSEVAVALLLAGLRDTLPVFKSRHAALHA
jgi:anti-anti-sigma factor